MTALPSFGSGDPHLDKQVADIRTELARLKVLLYFRGHNIVVSRTSMLVGFVDEKPVEPNGYLLSLKVVASLSGVSVFCAADGRAVVITRHAPAVICTWAEAIREVRSLAQHYRQSADT